MQRTDAKQVRRLFPDELIVGMELPGPILDQNGQVLIPGDQRLTEEHLTLLEQRAQMAIYGGDAWPRPEPAPPKPQTLNDGDELIAILKQRRRGRGSKKLRGHKRHRVDLVVQLTVVEEAGLTSRQRTLEVKTSDFSASGFGFFCPHYLHAGTVIYADFKSLPGKPRLKAIIRNCVYLEERRQHRIGAEFVRAKREPSDADTPPAR
jgi:hypothetical protein